MPESLSMAFLGLFVFLMLMPGLYAAHLFLLMIMAERRRQRVRAEQRELIADYQARADQDGDWPFVTTQIPLYNELMVARRVIEAVARIDYPRDRHHIQVLDDSTDDTRSIVDRTAAELRQRGFNITVVRRPDRTHYKAGALAHGLTTAGGEYVAIFDADFVPGPQFLRRLIPLIDSDPGSACVQARWGHLNAASSWMTDALAVGIDGHFAAEQPGRAWNGFCFNFNGTAGIWRRSAIDDPRVGGWHGDTITEDLDLSYRAQLAGWRMHFCLDEVAPAEIPDEPNALKAQQRRWATGSIQTARKLLPTVWRAANLTILQKLEATIHMTAYCVNVFMLLAIVFGRPLLWFVPEEMSQNLLAYGFLPCFLAAAGSWTVYIYSRWSLGQGVLGPLRLLRLIVLGLGLSVNNTVAVFAGLTQRGGEFVRTPKSGASGASDGAACGAGKDTRSGASPYAAIRSRLWMLEIAIGVFCLLQWAWFLPRDGATGGAFLLLYAIGLLLLGWQSRPRSAPRRTDQSAPQPAPAPQALPQSVS